MLFKSSALRYSLSKCCYHAITAVDLEVSVLPASALASSSLSAPFSTAPAQFALFSPALEAGPQLWSLLLLSLPVLHARALVGELAGAASEYSSAINLLRNKLKLPHIFAKQLDEAAFSLFPKLQAQAQAQARPSCAGAGILALGHFQRFFRAYYHQVSRKPEQVVQYALTFPSGTSHCAKLTSPHYYIYYYYYYYCNCYYYDLIIVLLKLS